MNVVTALRACACDIGALLYCMYAVFACLRDGPIDPSHKYYLNCLSDFRGENSLTQVIAVSLFAAAIGICYGSLRCRPYSKACQRAPFET